MIELNIIENILKKNGWNGARDEQPKECKGYYFFKYVLSDPNRLIHIQVEMNDSGELFVDDSQWKRILKTNRLIE